MADESTGPASRETAAQALERAQAHARRALGEALASVRALLDAASIGWSGKPSEAHSALRGIAELLDEQSARIQDGQGAVPAPVMNAVLEALDQEIGRWEKRAASDSEARAVLRTFLGLREILWEFGLRRNVSQEPSNPTPTQKKASTATSASQGGKVRATRRNETPNKNPDTASGRRRGGRRVQRVDVRGR